MSEVNTLKNSSDKPTTSDASKMDELSPEKATTTAPQTLTGRERSHLTLLVFAYACLMSSTTMVVGTSSVVVLSVGGSNSIAPISLASFFLGSAFISLGTSELFKRGRKFGFLFGNVLGFFGAALGGLSVGISSPALVILSYLPLGAANGIGLYLRFAAVEVVPPFAKAFAVTLVLAGGVIAAFAGPESAAGTRDIFGEDLTYLGVFMMIGIWNILMGVIVSFVGFPSSSETKVVDRSDKKTPETSTTTTLSSLLQTRAFLVPATLAALSWAIMAMPMSMVRVAMSEVGFTSRQSLLTIELHFLGMFAPGFISGKIIAQRGALFSLGVTVIFFLGAILFNLLSFSEEDGTLATWMIGLVLIGVGWNFGFSTATVMLTSTYADAPAFKAPVQAANDFLMFLLSGTMIVSTGYVYAGGGNELSGWRAVNYVVLAMTGAFLLILVMDWLRERSSPTKNRKEQGSHTRGTTEHEEA